MTRTRQIETTLPAAWRELIEEEDELLLELIADKVESLCGFKPDPDMVARFLAFIPKAPVAPAQPLIAKPTPTVSSSTPITGTPIQNLLPPSNSSRPALTLRGKRSEHRNAREVLVATMESLADLDPSFLDRFAALPKHGRTRRYISHDRLELYPGRPDLAQEHATQLRSGWWLGTNVSKRAIERIIQMACAVAGIRYGIDLTAQL